MFSKTWPGVCIFASFAMKGIAYQLTRADPLMDKERCQRDASLVAMLGTNPIRACHVGPRPDNIDLKTFTTLIDSIHVEWNQTQVNAYFKSIDVFHSLDNTFDFLVGSEFTTLNNQALAAPDNKTAIRDVRAYRNQKKYRNILIRCSAVDVSEFRPMLHNCLACVTNSADATFFFGLNAYKKIEETNDYGLVSYGPMASATAAASGIQAGISCSGTPTRISPDFANLQNTWRTPAPTGIKSLASTPGITKSSCPIPTADGWMLDGDFKLPSISEKLATFEPSATSSAASPFHTKGTANGGKEITGMGIGLVGVCLGFMYWL